MMITKKSEPQALYLHVPFCKTICGYCDFCHVTYRSDLVSDWLKAIQKEIDYRMIPSHLETIYIGGGTPSCLKEDELKRLLDILKPHSNGAAEYTIEINPETLTQEKADIIASYGVNRASVGYQTDDTEMLKLMNRHHSISDTANCIDILRQSGIHNISLDIMYSLPGQTLGALQQSVRTALLLRPEHLSLYSLTIEPGTVFFKKGYKSADEDLEADMYEWICSYLPTYGYQQYEISNFSKMGYASRHNLTYWHYEDFYGIGCGASGKMGKIRYDHTRLLSEYERNPIEQQNIVLTEEDLMFEFMMMGLRLKQGIRKIDFIERFGADPEIIYKDAISRLVESGELICDHDSIRCSKHGYEILNDVLEELLPSPK